MTLVVFSFEIGRILTLYVFLVQLRKIALTLGVLLVQDRESYDM